ncbi:MAG: sulfatase-like hydrolase/transferase, partial [Bacteroidota bacterium]
QNVIFVVGDDHSYTTLGAYGNKLINTPNMDRLAQEGLLFQHAYANAPICSASRQSMLTGKYPHTPGVNLLFTPFPDNGNITIAEVLREEGFETAIIGKNHFNHFIYNSLYVEGTPDHGFNQTISKSDYKKHLKSYPPDPIPENIKTRSTEKPEKVTTSWLKNAAMLPAHTFDKDSEGTFFANKATEFITTNKNKRFCLWLAFHEPHAPFHFPIEYTGKYDPNSLPLPQGSPEDDRWIPEQFKDLSETERRGIIASYYTSVEYMDKNLGLVLDAVEANGIKENTLIIYVSDQGYLLNDHKRFEKHTFWKESIKSPMIISGGDKLLQNKQTTALVELIDMVPTTLDLLGFTTHVEMQGKSFATLLQDNSINQHKDFVFAEYLNDNKMMVANNDWKYVLTSGKRDLDLGYETGKGPSGIYHKLYDLNKDEEETTNLAFQSDKQALVKTMQEKMLTYFMETHPDANRCPNELNLIGKLIWFSEPRDIGGEYTDKPYRIFYNEAFEEVD